MFENVIFDANEWLVIILLLIIIGFFLYHNYTQRKHLDEIIAINEDNEKAMTSLRSKKQLGLKSQLKGDISEMLIPWMTRKTGCTSTELRHYGDPIDWIGFKGMDKPDEEISIQFIEVKSGTAPAYLLKEGNEKSPLRDNERRVQEAVKRKDVHHQLIYINSKEVKEHLEKIGV